MRFARHPALDLLAAVLVMAPLVTSRSIAAEPAGVSDDLYVNACNAARDESACGLAHTEGEASEVEAIEIGPTESQAVSTSEKCGPAEPNPTEPRPTLTPETLASGDDLFPLPATPLMTPPATSETEGLKVAQSLEVVPAPDPFAAPESPHRLPAAPPATGLNRPITSLTLDAAADPELVANLSRLKPDVAISDGSIARFGSWDDPIGDASSASSRFAPQLFSWAAPALYTNPIYFQQPNLERYGHYVAVCERDNLTQSAISAAHFFVSVPALPYMVGAAGPCECNYVLGNYRPGSCNPHQLVKPPLSFRGLVYEGVAATGMVFFLP